MAKGRARSLPRWAKGRKIIDAIDGSEHFERDSRMYKQRGQWVHRSNYDKILDKDRVRE